MPRTRSEWGRWLRPRVFPMVLVAAGILLAVWIAVRSSQPTPPNFAEYAVLTVGSSLASIFGGSLLGRVGRIDPMHARSVVRQLGTAGQQAYRTRTRLEIALESDEKAEMITAVGIATAQLEALEEQFTNAVLDWNDIHPEALRDVMGHDDREDHGQGGPDT